MNLAPLEEQCVFLTSEPLFQLHHQHFNFDELRCLLEIKSQIKQSDGGKVGETDEQYEIQL